MRGSPARHDQGLGMVVDHVRHEVDVGLDVRVTDAVCPHPGSGSSGGLALSSRLRGRLHGGLVAAAASPQDKPSYESRNMAPEGYRHGSILL